MSDWRAARGAVPDRPGAPRSEDVIRRLRDNYPTGGPMTGEARLDAYFTYLRTGDLTDWLLGFDSTPTDWLAGWVSDVGMRLARVEWCWRRAWRESR